MIYSWICYDGGKTWSYNGPNPAPNAAVEPVVVVGQQGIIFYTLPSQYRVLWNGILLNPSHDYALSGYTLTFAITPDINDSLVVDVVIGTDQVYIQDIATYSSGAWHLSQAPVGSNIDLFWNGVLLRYNYDYTISGTTITFLTVVPDSTDFVAAAYSY